MATIAADNSVHTRHGLRVASAVTLCFAFVTWQHLEHANLAVWTTYMVMAQAPFTMFQKGIERIVGRAVGILLGVLLSTLFVDAWLLRHFLEIVLLTGLFYLYFADRLAYTFLNAGLYLIVLVHLGADNPGAAIPSGEAMFLAVVAGVVSADLVLWLTGAERSIHIEVGTAVLWPIRIDWLNHSLMLVATQSVVLFLVNWLDLSADSASFSVFMIAMAPDVQSSLQKGELRLLGAVLAVGWAFLTFLAVAHSPHWPLLALLLFVGIFLAAYLARVGGASSYAGVQMGLVLTMLIVVPPSEVGDINSAWQRIQGILAAIAGMVMVGSLWPYFPQAPPPPVPGSSVSSS